MTFQPLSNAAAWNPSSQWQRITTIDSHACGEPFRVIIDGYPDLPGDTMLARRRFAQDHHDHIRRALMWEPRGHADMYGCIVTPPVSGSADAGLLFLHNEGYSTMCGHGIIAFTTVAFETGMFPASEPEATLGIDTPAGLITATARVNDGQVKSIRFQNVPSFVQALDETIEVEGYGTVRYDLAFGGAFYAYVRAAELGLACRPEDYRPLIEIGMAIKKAVMAGRTMQHPFEPDLNFLYGTIFIDDPLDPHHHSRNVCIFADGEVDRSPTGTGVSGRLSIHFARADLGVGESITIESIIGSCFTGRVASVTRFGPYDAIIPEVEGTAHITGRHEFLIDPADELQHGFLLR